MGRGVSEKKTVEDILSAYWQKHYLTTETDPKIGSYIMCSLCGNHGVIDTRGRAISPKGNDMGRRNFCICPNGLAMRRSSIKLAGGSLL